MSLQEFIQFLSHPLMLTGILCVVLWVCTERIIEAIYRHGVILQNEIAYQLFEREASTRQHD